MTNLIEYAKEEFVRAGWLDKETGKYLDEMQESICENVLELLNRTKDQGHSGTSINYMLNLFNRLVQYRPLVPLTGSGDEWIEFSDGYFQNKYCSSVFKDSTGKCYDIDSKVYYRYSKSEENPDIPVRDYFTKGGGEHLETISFPYFPSDMPEYIFEPSEDFPEDLGA